MAGFACGHGANSKDYIDFARDYLPAYDPVKLYKDLRCEIVHNFSEGGSYVFCFSLPQFHGREVEDGRVIINLENFIGDLKNAMYKLLDEIRTDSKKRRMAVNRLKQVGLIGVSMLAPPKIS
jgi:hypothetical protein